MTVKQRPKGTHGLQNRPPGSDRWVLRVNVGRDPGTGRPRQISRVFRGGKREAQTALDVFAREVAQGLAVGTRATLGKLLDEWLANLERIGRARATLETYRVHVEKHIRPALGSVRLDRLSAHDLDRYFGALADKGLSAATIKLDHAVISGALTQGVDWGWLQSNPAKRARLRQIDRHEVPGLTIDQLRRLYRAASEDDFDMATTIALAAMTGCRRGELCGLRWSDVDRDRGTVRVERALVPGVGGQYLTTTKTKKARTVGLGTEGMAILARYWDHLSERWAKPPDPNGWLLSYDGGATPLRAKTVSEYVTKLGQRLKPPITVTLRQFRSFAATELVHQGVDLPTAAGQLGHSTAVMAQSYLRTTDDRRDEAAAAIGAVVGRALEPETSPGRS
ncbi:MAG TPA: site-specific integrase [Acidimicrobiales bacterium]|nr:site-specific integrase [Acidimicrobiales bacterium]